MEPSNIDPAFTYTDEQVALLKDELLTELKNLQKSILQTQRFLAALSVRVTHNESLSHSTVYSKASTQFSSEITAAMIKIESSKKPLDIATKFRVKRWDDLKKMGVKSLEIA